MAKIRKGVGTTIPVANSNAPQTAPAKRQAIAEPDLPRQHQGQRPELEQPKSFFGKLSALLHRHDRAVSAVLIGATVVPAVAGAPMQALAQDNVETDAAKQDAPVAENGPEAEALARSILFGKTPVNDNKQANELERLTKSIQNGEHAGVAGAMKHLLAKKQTLPTTWSHGTVRLVGMQEALQRMLLERQFPPQVGVANPGEPTLEDMTQIEDAVRGMGEILGTTEDVPGYLVADLDHVTRSILDAKPGQVGDAIDQALKTAPSLSQTAPTAPTAPTLPGAPTGPGAPIAPNNPTADLRRALSSLPLDAATRAQAALTAYAPIGASLDNIASSLPPWDFTLFSPISYDDGAGTRLRIPAGSSFDNVGGQLIIDAPSLLVQRDDVSLAAGHTTIKLADGLESFSTDSVSLSDDGKQVDLTKATLGVDRDAGAAFLTADEAMIDLGTQSIHVTGAAAHLDPDGTLDARAATLLFTQGNDSTWIEGFQATQTADGTTTASADVADVLVDGTHVVADQMNLSIAGPVTTISADAVDVSTGELDASAKNAILRVTNGDDGSTAIRFAGDDVTFQDAGRSLTTTGRSTVSLEHRPDGTLEHASASASSLKWTDSRGVLDVTGGEIDLDYGPDGKLRTADASANKLSFDGDAGKLTADGGDLSLRYDEQGVLRKAQASATGASYTGDRGALNVADGKVDMVFGPDGKASRLTGEASQVDFTGTNGEVINASGATLDVGFGKDGNLSRASTTIGTLDATLASGDQVKVTDGAADLKFDADGNLRRATATAGSLEWTGTDSSVVTAGGAALDATYDDAGLLSKLTATAETATYSGTEGTVNATGGALDLTYDNGQLKQIHGSTQHLEASAELGDIVADGETTLDLTYTDAGKVGTVNATAEHLTHTKGDRVLDLTGGALALDFGDDGVLDTATASVASGSYEGEFGKLTIDDGGSLTLGYEDGQLSSVNGQVGDLALTGEEANLDITGGTVAAAFGDDGALQSMTVHGDEVKVLGNAANGHDLDIAFSDVDANVTVDADGTQTVSLSGKDGAMTIDGNKVDIEEVETLEIQTGPDGTIDRLEADFPGTVSFEQAGGDLKVSLQGAHAEIEEQGTKLSASFDQADVALISEGMTATITDASLTSTDTQLRVHVGSAEVIKDLEKEMHVKVEGVDLIVDKTAEGAAKALDVKFASLDAHVVGMDIMASTQNGERVRLHMEMGDDGKMIREAFLQIPEGGEIKIDKDDTHLTLGGSQTLSFEREHGGAYRLAAEGLDIEAVTKKAEVTVKGGSAAVSLNPSTGRLVIEKVHGTEIDVKVKDQHINIDIEKLDGFMVKMTGISGAAQGAQIHLVPTSDASTMTLEVHAKVKGIPVSLELDDVHELKMLGEVSEDQVHVYAGDPSGQGRIAIGAGPLKFEGSAIEIFAKYHDYDSQRMLNSVSRYMSKDGINLTKNLSVEPDGVLRLGTVDPGLNAELAVLLPRSTGALPAYVLDIGGTQDDGAGGAVFKLGGRGLTKSGTEYVGSVFVGAVPGSYLHWNQTQGSASFAGIPLPNEMRIGTTAIGGLSFERNDGPSRLSVDVGAFVNPGGFAPASSPIGDDTPYGAFGGVRYKHGDRFHTSLDALIDMPDGKPQFGGIRFTLGVNF